MVSDDNDNDSEGAAGRPNVRSMLARARYLLQGRHAASVSIEDPYAAMGTSDAEEGLRQCRRLDELAVCLGRELVGDPDIFLADDQREELYWGVGYALIDRFHEALLRDMDAEVGLWRRGDWSGLRDRGWLSDEGYLEYSQEYPDGNPSHQVPESDDDSDCDLDVYDD